MWIGLFAGAFVLISLGTLVRTSFFTRRCSAVLVATPVAAMVALTWFVLSEDGYVGGGRLAVDPPLRRRARALLGDGRRRCNRGRVASRRRCPWAPATRADRHARDRFGVRLRCGDGDCLLWELSGRQNARMSDLELRPSREVSAADWIEPRLRRFASGMSAVVPDGFPAYVRILHPAHGPSGTRDEHVRWATVTKWSARTMHRLAQFHAIASPAASEERGPAPWDGNSPDAGNLPIGLLRVLCAHLAEHTTTPASCWFCLWGGLRPPARESRDGERDLCAQGHARPAASARPASPSSRGVERPQGASAEPGLHSLRGFAVAAIAVVLLLLAAARGRPRLGRIGTVVAGLACACGVVTVIAFSGT